MELRCVNGVVIMERRVFNQAVVYPTRAAHVHTGVTAAAKIAILNSQVGNRTASGEVSVPAVSGLRDDAGSDNVKVPDSNVLLARRTKIKAVAVIA
jgi:hypothetical protein